MKSAGVVIGRVESIEADARATRWRFGIPTQLARFIASKGSIAVDGVSLTVNAVGADFFEVALIPHTQTVTAFAETTNLNVSYDPTRELYKDYDAAFAAWPAASQASKSRR